MGKTRDLPFVTVGSANLLIDVELACTDIEREQGLSGRDFLGRNQGMLFVYDTSYLLSFWMKDMKFPIDIIWIDSNYNIIDIAENVSPDSFPKRFQSKSPAQYVLEVNAGFCQKNNINVGNVVSVDSAITA